MNYLSVSDLNAQIKSILETNFFQVYLKGEISNITYHSSGHVYFSLKDNQSIIKAVMFRGNASKLKFRLEVGLTVLVNCAVTVYTPRGDYQLNCFNIEPYGVGNLHLAYEQLKKDLEAKGYFDESRKKTLPRLAKHIGIITSSTGAAIEDMKKIAQARWPLVKITLIDTIVQGENSKYSIADNIQLAQDYDFDVIIVGRGGGSFEDLFGFSSLEVALAIHESSIPVVSAVGHESDFAISDFVADVRASTPSNAVELILPDQNEVMLYLDDLKNRLDYVIENKFSLLNTQISNLKELYNQNSIPIRFEKNQMQLSMIKKEFFNLYKNILSVKYEQSNSLLEKLDEVMQKSLKSKQQDLNNIRLMYDYNRPKESKDESFVQLVKDNKLTKLKNVSIDDIISLEDKNYKVDAKIINKMEVN
jgi:exodeoxyribonuclease VII large subunit